MSSAFDPTSVNLEDADPRDVICYLNLGDNEYDGKLGARISALFVILITSSAATFFPVLAARSQRMRINIYVYLFAKYFGTGVIVATAFIHLLEPAYSAIGPDTCVGQTGGWADFPWCAALMLSSVMAIFLMDLGAAQYVARKYGFVVQHQRLENVVTDHPGGKPGSTPTHNQLDPRHVDEHLQANMITNANKDHSEPSSRNGSSDPEKDVMFIADQDARAVERSFQQQIAAFLILEFGVIFHSVIIGLNLGTAGSEFATLYPVLVFHQAFEGLGIGARMSAIPFPKRLSWLPWALCAGYGLTTPIAIAIGLGLRTTYNSGSFTAKVVSGVLDAISAGILLWTGLVEVLARDFIFNPELSRDQKRLTFMIVCVLLGAGLMALLGKWA